MTSNPNIHGNRGADAVGAYRDPSTRGSKAPIWIIGIILAVLLLLLLLWAAGVFSNEETENPTGLGNDTTVVDPAQP